MNLSAILQTMLDAGCTAEQIVAVVKTHEQQEKENKDLKRQKDADRQRQCRSRHKQSRNVIDVTQCHSDNALQDVTPRDNCDILDKESSPHTPFKEINPMFSYPSGISNKTRAYTREEKSKKIPETEKTPSPSRAEHTQSVTRSAPEKKQFETEFSEVFWPEYPNKVGRKPALASWLKARKTAELETIMDGLRRYVAGKPSDRQWLNPATFLNQQRWNDQPAIVTGNQCSPPAALPTDDAAWERRLKFARERKIWSTAEWGPQPGASGCRVPKHLLIDDDGKNWKEQNNDP